MKKEIKNLKLASLKLRRSGLKIENSAVESEPSKVKETLNKWVSQKESVEVKARYVKISFQKLNLVAKVVRRRPLAEVERVLTFSKTKAARITLQLLKSAKAAAVQKGLDVKRLYLSKLLTQQGPSLKRGQPVARGSSHPIAKKSAHLILQLEEQYGTKS